MNANAALAAVWQLGQMSSRTLRHATLAGADPVLPSSFAVGTAAQVPVAAAALAACELGHARGQVRQDVHVDMLHAALECVGWFSVDGRALQGWRALDFEQAAADHGLVVAALRRFDEWDVHPQGKAVAAQPLMTFERIGDAPSTPLLRLQPNQRPLSGLRALDLTRILAGPVCGRTLAAYGADVMLVNAPHLPNIESIATTSRGKLSAYVDLRTEKGRHDLNDLLASAHVLVQSYRPGGLDALGYGPYTLAQRKPGLVYVSLSAYGSEGPWRGRRGFDSLVQAATDFNHAEAEAAGSLEPKPLPMQILDYATGHLMAFAASAALLRQMNEGGSWHVRVSLAQTGQWIRRLGRVPGGFAAAWPDRQPYLESTRSGFGQLVAVRHSARLSLTPARWTRPSMPPGTDPPIWPDSGAYRS